MVNKYMNKSEEIELQDGDYSNQYDWEERRQSHEERMRYNKLCDDMDLIYDDIEKLCFWVTRPTNEDWEELERRHLKYEEIFNTKELDELYDRKEQIDDGLKKLDEKIQEMTDNNVRVHNYIRLEGMSNIAGGTEEELNQYIDNNEKITATYNALIFFVTIVAGIVVMLLENFRIAALIIGGILDLVFIDGKMKLKNGTKIMKKALSEHQVEVSKVQDLQKELDKLSIEMKDILYEIFKYEDERREELKDNIEFSEAEREYNSMLGLVVDRGSDDYTKNGREFYEFRRNHYNEDVERLFRKLGINIFSRIDKNDIIKTGSVKDYRDFIEDKVLNMDELYFEDYEEYRRLGDIEREQKYGKVKL